MIDQWARSFFLRLMLLVTALPSCSVNILETFADTQTDAALFYDAKMKINNGDYTGALGQFSLMSADYLDRREVKSVHASAYAGICGVDFLDMVDALANLGATRVMVWLMSTFQGGNATKQDACIQAETLIKEIGLLGASRTADENLLMAMIGFAKMGAIISRYGDVAPADGLVDGGFDPCNVGSLPSADAKEIATGFNVTMDALENIGSSTIGAGALTDVTTACGFLPVGYLPLCSDPPQVDTADIDANEELGIRSLINESQDVGLGVCTGDAAACACP